MMSPDHFVVPHRRVGRIGGYTFCLIAGAVSMVAPSQVLLGVTGSKTTVAYSAALMISSFICLLGAIRGSWAGEFIAIPLLGFSMAAFAVSMFAQASTDGLRLIPFGCIFTAFAFFLHARWHDVNMMMKFARRLEED